MDKFENVISSTSNDSEISSKEDKQLYDSTMNYLRNQISLKTGIPIKKLRALDPIEQYGMDSVVVLEIIKSLEVGMGRLSKTLLFEYNNLDELTHYFLQIKRDELMNLFGHQPVKVDHKLEHSDAKNETLEIGRNKTIRKKPFKQLQSENVVDPLISNSYDEMDEDIAVIGVACKFPMADNIDEYWKVLRTGKDCITEVPASRWDHSQYFDTDKSHVGKSYSKWGGFINDIDKFDPLFFNISPLEADFIDPQERLFLETTWKAFEEAGYSKESLNNRHVGVYVGVMFGLYQLIENDEYGGVITGRNNFASIANRVSYYFNFHGPSIALDTMCSSSLTALHIACNNIKSGECEMAVVGGVNLIVHPNKYVQLCQGNFLSTDGRCRSFGRGGDGYVPGEGVGTIIIKPLKKAIQDGDHIHTVIKGIGINASGKTSGYTTPSAKYQSSLINNVLEKSRIHPQSISYIEAHGTGTSLGDPIEIDGLTSAFAKYTSEKQYCAIGSVKANIGHTESAAGIASIIKVILQMKNKELVPSIHSDELNPFIDFKSTPFLVQQKLQKWEKLKVTIDGKEEVFPRRASVSAFGAGGANAYLILEEFEPEYVGSYQEEKKLFILSAKNQERLIEYVHDMKEYLSNGLLVENVDSVSFTKSMIQVEEILIQSISEIIHIKEGDIHNATRLSDLGFTQYDVISMHKVLEKRFNQCFDINLLNCDLLFSDIKKYIVDSVTTDLPKSKKVARISLDDLGYTLQVGRTDMEERLAVIASNIEELVKAYEDFLAGVEDNENIWHSNIVEHSDRFEHIVNSSLLKKLIEKTIEENDLNQLAELWILGVKFDWDKKYINKKKRRLSLPTYPFAKQRCWVTNQANSLVPTKLASTSDECKKEVQEKNVIKADNEIERSKKDSLNQEELFEFTVEYIKEVFSNVLKIPKKEISRNTDFEMYGIDSISVININQNFEKAFGKMPSTLLFTYKNLKTLSKYFVSNHKVRLYEIATGNNIIEVENKIIQNVSDSSVKDIPENTFSNQDIAIIGLSGKYPQSDSLDDFFEKLSNGKDFISTIPSERWDYREYPEVKCRWGSFLSDIDMFDPQFFNISPRTALYMDPQERQLIQSVWSCLEDAGYTPNSMENQENEDDPRGNIAVYAGVTFNEYGLYGAEDIARGNHVPLNSQIFSMANRISYLFNFGGPSLTVDSACSSSLYAIHLACESIRHGESEMAIAGGVNLSLHPSKYLSLHQGGFLASDGHCRSFGEGGDGYVPGEGVGAVLLKPLNKAINDGDNIYALIKGSAVNHGGKTYGYSVPNPVAQTAVIKKALKNANINPRTISYVEAHGTGTSLGDPIEITALTEAYRDYTNEENFCAIGSVKSNIGHLEAAAGISQLTKVILQMKNLELVPSRLNSSELNTNLRLEGTPFYIQQEKEEWKRPVIGEEKIEYNRRAGISSFGVGGVNVHLILEEYLPKPTKKTVSEHGVIIPLSAKTNDVLKEYVLTWLSWIEKQDKTNIEKININDVAYTLQKGRIELAYRVAFNVSSISELKTLMKLYIRGERNDKIIYGVMYTNQGDAVDYDNEKTPISRAKDWINGVISLSHLYDKDVEYKKLHLPVYPFQKERYWLYSNKIAQKTDTISIEEEIVASSKELSVNTVSEDKTGESVIELLAKAFENERLGIVINFVQKTFAQILGFTDGRLPDIHEGFFALGLESIETNVAYNILQDEFHIGLSELVFFDYPSIFQTSEYILTLIDFENIDNFQNEKTITSLINDEEAKPNSMTQRDKELKLGDELTERIQENKAIKEMSFEEVVKQLELEIQ